MQGVEFETDVFLTVKNLVKEVNKGLFLLIFLHLVFKNKYFLHTGQDIKTY